MTRSWQWRSSAAVAALLVSAAVAPAQQMLMPLSPVYRLESFVYEPPPTDGWRQLSKSPSGLEMVYAEQLPDGQISSRAHIVLEASRVPEGAEIADAAALAALSRQQQIGAHGDQVAGSTDVKSVPGSANLQSYSLLTKGIDPAGDPFEVLKLYYLMLAPDKSQYLMAMLATRETSYENTLYYSAFYGSLASLEYSPLGESSTPSEPVPSSPVPVEDEPLGDP